MTDLALPLLTKRRPNGRWFLVDQEMRVWTGEAFRPMGSPEEFDTYQDAMVARKRLSTPENKD